MLFGFASAILPDLSLEEVFQFAAANRFECVELMCWPVGRADRRYAGVTHIDADRLDAYGAREILDLASAHRVRISALGYYPNPLDPDPERRAAYIGHLCKLIRAAALLDVRLVNTFIGRDPHQSVEANFQQFLEVWPPIIAEAEMQGVRIAIENCPMYFTMDEWPGGLNLASTPAIWRRMFAAIPSAHFGLNYDPSHMVFQHMDYIKPIYAFSDRLFHIHFKDLKIFQDRLDEVGIYAPTLEYTSPKLPGLGDIHWGRFISALTDVGYAGPACIEVEDKAFEDSLESRKQALLISRNHLQQYLP